jgi:hypothetical protein
MKFDIERKSRIGEGFKSMSVKGQFYIEKEEIVERFTGEIDFRIFTDER